MATPWVEPATLEHVPLIAANARQADRDEVAASHGHSIERALELSVRLSYRAWFAAIDGEPAALVGVATTSLLSGKASPWLLGTSVIERKPKAFLRASRALFPALIDGARYLENYVDERNTLSQRWLEWLGFTLEPAEAWGSAGLPFRRFWMRNDHV